MINNIKGIGLIKTLEHPHYRKYPFPYLHHV